MVNCMLLSSGVPENLWEKALLSSCFILNRVLQKDFDVTPYEYWKRRTPNIQFFKVWGCLAKVSILEPKKRKIDHKTIDVIFIRYALDSNVNWFLVVNSQIREISNKTIIKVRDIVYFENIFSFKSRIYSNPSCTPSTSDILFSSSALAIDFENRRSKRIRTLTSFGEDFFTYLVECDPSSFKEAMDLSESLLWKEAIDSEVNSIIENNTWILSDLLPGCKPVGCNGSLRRTLTRWHCWQI